MQEGSRERQLIHGYGLHISYGRNCQDVELWQCEEMKLAVWIEGWIRGWTTRPVLQCLTCQDQNTRDTWHQYDAFDGFWCRQRLCAKDGMRFYLGIRWMRVSDPYTVEPTWLGESI